MATSITSDPTQPYVDVELFAGAGGLTLGLTEAGFPPQHVFEIDAQCCSTLRYNSESPRPRIKARIHEQDVASVDWSQFTQPVRLLAAGPPCQPFSNGGKQLAHRDQRNQFPSTLRAVRELRPAVVLLENVPGLLRRAVRPYLDYIVRQLTYPSVAHQAPESWQEHNARLLGHCQRSPSDTPEYTVHRWTMNVADYGIAQSRLRVFIVAIRRGLPPVTKPQPTNSRLALIDSQRTGAYWQNRALPPRSRLQWPRRARSDDIAQDTVTQPWVTVRDAIHDLPVPRAEDLRADNHWLIPGARLYTGHNGSELDWPAKTIKAGVHGVPGGENVLLLGDHSHRYFTLREMARLQGFPDDYIFRGTRSQIIRQIGNAVPCTVARTIAHSLRPILDASQHPDGSTPPASG